MPLYANTTDWVGLIPLPTTGRQAANLGNNNGASTAETATELALTNHVRAEGSYQGIDNNGDSPVAVTADCEEPRFVPFCPFRWILKSLNFGGFCGGDARN